MPQNQLICTLLLSLMINEGHLPLIPHIFMHFKPFIKPTIQLSDKILYKKEHQQ